MTEDYCVKKKKWQRIIC